MSVRRDCEAVPETCFCHIRHKDPVGGTGRVENEQVGAQGVVGGVEARTSADNAAVGCGGSVAEISPTVQFVTGATRSAETPYDPSGFISPIVLDSYCAYMAWHRVQADGELRESDNWQKGMPTSRAMRSITRHFFDLWLMSRGYAPRSVDCNSVEDALHAIMFNVGVLLKNRVDGRHHEPEPGAANWWTRS
jgi:hypothetical protein